MFHGKHPPVLKESLANLVIDNMAFVPWRECIVLPSLGLSATATGSVIEVCFLVLNWIEE